jgi:hypothetical protein
MLAFLIGLYAAEKTLLSSLKAQSLIDEDRRETNAYMIAYGDQPRTVSQLLALSKEYKSAIKNN